MKKLGQICRVAVFIALFALLFSVANSILIRKSLKGPWDMTRKIGGFYNEECESLDVIFLGSSHAYCSFSPLALYDDCRLRSYVFATQLQPFSATYHYMKEALKRQKPKLFVVEVFSGVFDYDIDDGIIHSFTDDIPLSINKIKMVYNCVPSQSRAENIFPLIKYHSRWEELEPEDYTMRRSELTDSFKGHVMLSETNRELSISSKDYDIVPISEDNEFYLKCMVELAHENGAEIIFVKTPTTDYTSYQGKIEYIKNLTKELGVKFIDFNVGDFAYEVNVKEDFYDARHLNGEGALKFCSYFSQFVEKYSDGTEDEMWTALTEAYMRDVSK